MKLFIEILNIIKGIHVIIYINNRDNPLKWKAKIKK
jgi:hypothetical protein